MRDKKELEDAINGGRGVVLDDGTLVTDVDDLPGKSGQAPGQNKEQDYVLALTGERRRATQAEYRRRLRAEGFRPVEDETDEAPPNADAPLPVPVAMETPVSDDPGGADAASAVDGAPLAGDARPKRPR